MVFFNVKGDILEKWEIPTRTENNGVNILPDVAATIDAKIQEKASPRHDRRCGRRHPEFTMRRVQSSVP